MQNEATKLTSLKGDPNPNSKWLHLHSHSRSPPHVDALSHYQSTYYYYCVCIYFVIVSFCVAMTTIQPTDVLTLISQSAFCITLWVSIAAFYFTIYILLLLLYYLTITTITLNVILISDNSQPQGKGPSTVLEFQ